MATLFDTPAGDYVKEIKLRLKKLDTIRTFIERSGANRKARIIYTLPMTCTHEIFDRVNHKEFNCRTCGASITEKQINPE